MAGEWKEKTLASLIEVKHGYAFSGEHIHDEPPGDILLTPGNFAIGGGFKGEKFKYFDGDVPEEFVLKEGDLLITMTDLSKQGDTLGYPAFVPKPQIARFLHNQRLGKVIIRPDAKIDKRFLFYLLRTTEYRHEVLASATGTTVKHTSPGRILAHKAKFPPLPEQKAIAHILGALDDKIEVLRRMNETLEAMARAIFKSWFIDFDPVRAKAQGRNPGLPKEISNLFPSSFQDSDLGEIPKGWRAESILESAYLLSGGTPKTSVPEYWDGSIPWVSAKDVGNSGGLFILKTDKTITQEGVDNSATKMLPAKTSIVTARGTVGAYCILSREMAMNQTNYGLKAKEGVGDYFIYYCLVGLVERLKQMSYGTIFDTITTNTFKDALTIKPSGQVLDSFESIVTPIMDKILNNLNQSQTLAVIRDALLPRLLSGELRVKDAEKFIGSRAL